MQFDDDQSGPPCVFGLMAGTVALMTRYADPATDGKVGPEAMRSLIARKIVSNLFFLQHHPGVPAPFAQVAANAHQHWTEIAAAATDAAVPIASAAPCLH
ncbi:MAG: hypothetical protein ACK4KV_05035 [Rhodocyclaceae bacterium]